MAILIGREADVVATYIEADWATYEPIGLEKGALAVGAAMMAIPAVSDLALRATEGEFGQVMLRAFAIAAIRMTRYGDLPSED